MGDDKGFSKEDYHALYGLTEERYAKLADQAIIMHPARLIVMWRLLIVWLEAPKRLVSLLRCKTGSLSVWQLLKLF